MRRRPASDRGVPRKSRPRRRSGSPAGRSCRGITILEIMIVLAIVGLMMLIGFPAARSLVRSDMRGDASQVASMIRAGHELASLSGIHHRIVFDLDEGSFKLEACPE